jgi:hypothetical protein
VRIVQAFYALFLGQRTSRSTSSTVSIGVASERFDASRIFTAFSSESFGISPVEKRAVSMRGTFNTATTIQVAVRSTLIITLIVISAVIHAYVGTSIAILLALDFTTIGIPTAFSYGTASITVSITTAVRSARGAIRICYAISAGSIGLATWLVWVNSSIESSAVGVGSTGSANTSLLAIVLASKGFAVIVIVGIIYAHVRVDAASLNAKGIASVVGRSVVGNAISVVGASSATTIVVAIFSGQAVVIGIASIYADSTLTNSLA